MNVLKHFIAIAEAKQVLMDLPTDAWEDDVENQVMEAISKLTSLETELKKLKKHFMPELIKDISKMASTAYTQYLQLSNADICRGEEAKIKSGEFTLENLNAHREAEKELGMHKAFAKVRNYLHETAEIFTK